MESVHLYGYEWSSWLIFLFGPAGLLLLFWAVLENRKVHQRTGLAAATVLLLAFAVSADKMQYGTLQFHPSLSSMKVEELYESSLEKSRELQQPVLFYFHADWCTHCDELRHRLEKKSTLDLLSGFLLVSVDVTEEDQFSAAHERFGLHQVPGLAFGNSRGQLLAVKLEGAHFPEGALIDVLKKLRDGP